MSKDTTPIVQCKCGSVKFWRRYSVTGVWEDLVEAEADDLKLLESNTNSIRHGSEPVTLTCADCGRHVKNPNWK